MADRDSERDRRVRELLSEKGKKQDNQAAVLGQARAEVQDIQSELYNHLAIQQTQDQARLRETQTISQAAQGMLAMEAGDVLQNQAAQMNAPTQAALGKFGVKPQRTQNSSRNQSSQKIVTKTGDTTNIRNENITNNRTEIRVTQPSIPISQPQIPMQGVAKKEDNTAKFKAWLSGMFAKQQNEAEIQKKEYRKKEWNLGRTTTRLMAKIGDSVNGLSNKLNPQNMTSSLTGQLKWLLLIFGATMIGKIWKPAMKVIANLESGFRMVFGLPMNEELKRNTSGTYSVIDNIKKAIGIDNKNESLISGLGKVFTEGIDKLIDKLKFWFEDRATALKEVEFPKMSIPDFGFMGKVMGPAMEGIMDAFKGVGQYLGDIITVAMGGSKGKVKVEARKVQRQAQETFTSTKGKEVSLGDSALASGQGRNYMRKSDYDTFGNLKGNASSTQAMSQSLISMFNDRSNTAHTAEIATGVSQLMGAAKRNGQVVIDPELLRYLGLTQADIVGLQRNKQLRQDTYRIIGVKPNEAQKKEMGVYEGLTGTKIGATVGSLSGMVAGGWAGMKGGAALGTFAGGPVGTFIGGGLGMIGGGLTGYFLGGAEGAAIGYGGDRLATYISEMMHQGLYPKLVGPNSDERGADGSLGVPKKMWVLTKEGADKVATVFTRDMSPGNKEMDLTNKEFFDKLRRIEERKKRQNGVQGGLTQSQDLSELNASQLQYKVYTDNYHRNFESDDPTSNNMIKYGHYNGAMASLGKGVDWVQGQAANMIQNSGNFVARERLGTKEQEKRAAYAMKRLIDEGLKPHQAAGIVGNIMRESAFVANSRVVDSNNRPAGGLVGWNGINLERVEKYFREKSGGKWPNITYVPFEEQLELLIKELKGEFNGMTALDRDGWAKRYGGKDGSKIWDLMTKAESLEAAVNLFERTFEGSGDYKGYRDYKNGGVWKDGNGNKYRIEYGYAAMKLNPQYANSVGDYKSQPLPNLNLKGLDDNEIKTGERFGFAWIGDSQTVVGKGLLATTVLPAVSQGSNCVFYGQASANAGHYLGTSGGKLGDIATNMKVSNCKDALEEILKVKPKYCIIALGHNGTTGYSSLASKLKGVGSEIIGIKMWPIDGSKHGMATYTSEQMKKMYEGISSVDHWVDLTNMSDLPKSDGVHITTSGCYIVAREIISQIAGNAPATSDELKADQNFLQTQSGLLGNSSTIAREYADQAADVVRNLGKPGEENSAPSMQYTAKQKEILEQYRALKVSSEKTNRQSYLDKGARSDSTGTYFWGEGGYRFEVDPQTSSALVGVNPDDFTSVTKYNKQTGKFEAVENEEEAKAAKDSMIMSISSLFSKYEGKGSTDDVMVDEKGNKIKFHLGRFRDIDSFSKVAQKNCGGFIDFWIYFKKDKSKYSIIEINSFPSGIWDNSGNNNEGSTRVGPWIYQLGRQWLILGTKPSEKKYTDWQPAAQYNNVWLTPAASEKYNYLLSILSFGKLSVKDGRVYKENGEELTRKELNDAIDFGIVKGPKDGGQGVNTSFGVNYSITDGYNNYQYQKDVEFTHDKFNFNSYFETLGVGLTKEDREKYLKDNKKNFFFMNGKIYGASGVEWGTYDPENKDKIQLYDNDTLTKLVEQTGNEGLRQNQAKMTRELTRQHAVEFGIVDRNTIANFMAGVNTSEPISKEEQERITKRKTVKKGNKNYITYKNFIIKHNKLWGTEISYYIFFDESGEPKTFKITADQLTAFGKAYYRGNFTKAISDIKDTTEEGLLEKISEYIIRYDASQRMGLDTEKNEGISLTEDLEKLPEDQKAKILEVRNEYRRFRDKHGGFYGHHIENDWDGSENFKNSEIDKLAGELTKGLKEVADIKFDGRNHQIVTYEDGTKGDFTYFIPEAEKKKIAQEYIKQINDNIKRSKGDIRVQRSIDTYSGSELETTNNDLLKQIEEGKLGGNFDNNLVTTNFGDVVGTYTVDDKGNKVVSQLTAEQALKYQVDKLQEDRNFKIAFYQKHFGAIYEDGHLYAYDPNGNGRAEIDLSKPLTGNLREVLKNAQARTGKNSSWDDLSKVGRFTYDKTSGRYNDNWDWTGGGDENSVGIENLYDAISHGFKDLSTDLNDIAFDDMLNELENQTSQGETEAERREKQLIMEKDNLASTIQTAKILQRWADSGFKTMEDGAFDDIKDLADQIRNSALDSMISNIPGAKKLSDGSYVYEKDGHLHRISIDKATLTKKDDDLGTFDKFTEDGTEKYRANGVTYSLAGSKPKSSAPVPDQVGPVVPQSSSPGNGQSSGNGSSGQQQIFNIGQIGDNNWGPAVPQYQWKNSFASPSLPETPINDQKPLFEYYSVPG